MNRCADRHNSEQQIWLCACVSVLAAYSLKPSPLIQLLTYIVMEVVEAWRHMLPTQCQLT